MLGLGAALCALLAGCSTSQARATGADEPSRDLVELQTRAHGNHGYAIARAFNSESFRENMKSDLVDETVVVDEFYTVRVARDLTRRDVLTDAGYSRRRFDRESKAHFYEFFDTGWKLLAYLDTHGQLFVVNSSGKGSSRGTYQVDDALILVYQARNGFSYDVSGYDQARAKSAFVNPDDKDSEDMRSRSPRERGIFLRGQRENAPVVEMRRYRGLEAGVFAESFQKERFDARKAEELRQLREQRRGTEAGDGTYGGLEFKDGQPVGPDGQPLKRGDAGK